MPLSSLLKSAAGILSREHPDRRRTYQAGWNEMVRLAGAAAASHTFDVKSLRLSLAETAGPTGTAHRPPRPAKHPEMDK